MKNFFLTFATIITALTFFTSCSTDDSDITEEQIQNAIQEALASQQQPEISVNNIIDTITVVETETMIQVVETELGNIVVQTPENHRLVEGEFLTIEVDIMGYTGHTIDEIETEIRTNNGLDVRDFIELESVTIISERLNMDKNIYASSSRIEINSEPVDTDYVLDGQLYSFVMVFQVKDTLEGSTQVSLDMEISLRKTDDESGISSRIDYELDDDIRLLTEYIISPNTSEPAIVEESPTSTGGTTQEQIDDLLDRITELQEN